MILNTVISSDGGSGGKVQIQEGSVETPFLPFQSIVNRDQESPTRIHTDYRLPVATDSAANPYINGNAGMARGESIYVFNGSGASYKLFKGEWGVSDIPTFPLIPQVNACCGFRYFEKDDVLFAACSAVGDIHKIYLYRFSTGVWADISAGFPYASWFTYGMGITVCEYANEYHFFKIDRTKIYHAVYNLGTSAWTTLPSIEHGYTGGYYDAGITGAAVKNGKLYLVAPQIGKFWSWDGTSYVELASPTNQWYDSWWVFSNQLFPSYIDQDKIIEHYGVRRMAGGFSGQQVAYSINDNAWTYQLSLR